MENVALNSLQTAMQGVDQITVQFKRRVGTSSYIYSVYIDRPDKYEPLDELIAEAVGFELKGTGMKRGLLAGSPSQIALEVQRVLGRLIKHRELI